MPGEERLDEGNAQMKVDCNDELQEMAARLQRQDCVDCFRKIHHYKLDVFSSPPPSLKGFLKYCASTGYFLDGENPQTIRRALAVCELAETGSSIKSAVDDAWIRFPLRTRKDTASVALSAHCDEKAGLLVEPERDDSAY